VLGPGRRGGRSHPTSGATGEPTATVDALLASIGAVPPPKPLLGPAALRVRDTAAANWITFTMRVLPTSEVEKFSELLVSEFEKAWDGAKAMNGGQGTIETSIGPAHERRWYISGLRLRVATIPLCQGMRTLVLTGSLIGDETRTADYETLLGSLRQTKEDPPPACR